MNPYSVDFDVDMWAHAKSRMTKNIVSPQHPAIE